MAVAYAAGNRKAATGEQWLTGSDTSVARSSKELLAANTEDANYSLMTGGGAQLGPRLQPQASKGGAKGTGSKAPKANQPGKQAGQIGKSNKGDDRCTFYNKSNCSGGRADGQTCPVDSTKVHTCAICGRGHPAYECHAPGAGAQSSGKKAPARGGDVKRAWGGQAKR